MILDHIAIGFEDYERAKTFYAATLAPLGVALAKEIASSAGFGRDGRAESWITATGRTTPRVHLAFRAASREEVRAFHHAAMSAGAVDNGAPGLRPHYHPDYYGAFCIDPEGHSIEAACHAPG